jgi:hypothetical protein
MKQIKDNSISGLEECVIAPFFIGIVLLGMILHICVGAADIIRGWKRRATRQADARSITETQVQA